MRAKAIATSRNKYHNEIQYEGLKQCSGTAFRSSWMPICGVSPLKQSDRIYQESEAVAQLTPGSTSSAGWLLLSTSTMAQQQYDNELWNRMRIFLLANFGSYPAR